MKINRVVATLCVLLVAAVSCKQAPKQQAQINVRKLIEVQGTDISLSEPFSASIRGQQDIDIYPQVSGYLSQIAVVEGQRVKKGDLLFKIEAAPFAAAYQAAQASVEVAKAGVANAQLNYDNSLMLRDKNIISDAELQSSQNSLASAKAQLTLAQSQMMSAKVNLDFTTIKSPSDGVVGTLPYRQGALVSPSQPQSLTVVSDNSQMYVYFSMGENRLLNLIDKYGSLDSVVLSMPEVELQLNNNTIYNHKGRIESISGVIQSTTGSVSVRAAFPNKEQRLLSGGTGNILLPHSYNNTIVIPKAATYELQNRVFVYRVIDGQAKSTPIQVESTSSDQEYIVTGGLSVGDVIIAEGAGLVREGERVSQQ